MATLHTPYFQVNSLIPPHCTRSLVFIDMAVEDYQSLVKGVISNTEVFVIDPTQNGVEKITEVLATRANQNLSSIHIVCHGLPGSLQLGNTHLGLDTLDEYSQQLQQWQKIFTASSKTVGLSVEEEEKEQGVGSKGDSLDGDSTPPKLEPLSRSEGIRSMFCFTPQQEEGGISPCSLPHTPYLFVESATESPAKLLIYGCNVADGDVGAEFITKLHQLTGANIAASRQRTGNAALGGNWDLEVRTADMEVTLAFAETTQKAYAGVLATFTVNSTGDADDGNPNNHVTTLREAINLANATAGDDAIAFGKVFTDTIPDVITLTSGKLTITDDVTILGTGASKLTVSGNNTSRVFEIAGLATGVSIDGLAIASGGIQVNSNSILSLTRSSVTGNTQESGISNNGILSLTRSSVSGNTKGGIYNGGILSLRGSRVFGNTGDFGGGIYNDGSNANTGNLSLTASTVSGNTANYGGGIYNQGGTLSLMASTVSGNTANYNGGGIVNGDDGSYFGGSATLTNSTISGNTANGEGGGIFNTGSYVGNDNLTLINITITNNIADSDSNGVGNGGGVANPGSPGSPMKVSNTIIAGNFDKSPSGDIQPDLSGRVTDFGNNLIGDNTGTTDFTTSILVGTTATPIDPKLGSLQNNGGATFTHALLADSPAINAGNNSLVPSGVTTDQRGARFDRISGVAVDIGSYEVQPTIITPPNNPNPLVPNISIIATDNTADENSGNTGTYRISRSNSSGALTVHFSANGNASIADYNLSMGGKPVSGNSIVIANSQSYVDITLKPVNDIQAEAAENLTLSLAADSAYQIDNVNYTATVAIAANDFVVTNTNDSGDGSLRQAILNANATAGADIITFAGVFSDATPDIITLTTGKLTITDDITLLGTGAANLTVSGNNASGVFEISGTGTDANIDGLKIANANDAFGGILLNNNTTLNLTGSTVSDNRGAVGGIFNKGTLSLIASTVSNNSGSSFGGGIFNKGNLSLTNSIVSANNALISYSSAFGGGIFNTGTLSITGSTVSGNGAFASGLNRGGPDPYPSYGGGIYNSGTVNLTSSTVSGSTAETGGGIYNSGIFNLSNSTISGNRAYINGGGIINSGTLTLTNNTITNNSAEDFYGRKADVGGIFNYSDGTVVIGNSIIAGNLVREDPYVFSPDVTGNFTDIGNNLIGDNTGSTGFTTSTLVGTSANPIHPKLSPLQNNGGITFTNALIGDSPAINAGNNALIPAGITTDQRGTGFDRISEGRVDIGALEFNGLSGTNGADNLVGKSYGDIINAKAGNDTITGNQGNDILTGGGGKDKFVYNLGDSVDTITDFSGLGKGSNPSAAVIGELDTLKFKGAGLTAQNLLLTQNGNNLEVTFEGVADDKVILQNFALEKLDNLSSIGNILFDGQTKIRDSFDVFNANSNQSTIFNKNTVTFLNDLNNNTNGFDNSADVINGQGGDDRINGKSGNDLLRGGEGNDTLLGSLGNDTLVGSLGNDSLIGDAGNDIIIGGAGGDTLTGGSGHDQFIYQTLSDSDDTITDFDLSQDKLVFTDLFKSRGYSNSNPVLDGNLQFVQSGTSTLVQVLGYYSFYTFATLDNFTATNLVVGGNVFV